MNAKLIIYRKEKIQNYESLKQLCLLMNIEIILLNEQMTQNKVKDILNKKIKKTKKNNLEPAVVVFSNVASLQMDQILPKLKNNSTLCLKAVVTATNYNWTFEKLDFINITLSIPSTRNLPSSLRVTHVREAL